MQLTAIDWPWKPLATWNPVTGCKRACPFCYARRIHERFHKTPFSDVVFHPERMMEKPCAPHVFVGSMSDIDYWKPEWIEAVIGYCASWPGHNFYFLSKNPLAYKGYGWPDNCCLGLTMTLTQTEHCQKENINAMMEYRGLMMFLSIEPLLGKLAEGHSLLERFEKIIVGAITGPGAVKPRPEWIDSIKRLKLDNVYWKANIKTQAE